MRLSDVKSTKDNDGMNLVIKIIAGIDQCH